MQCLLGYHWNGNVRELENLIERLAILTNNDIINISDLPEKFLDEQTLRTSKSRQILSIQNLLTDTTFPETGCDLNEIISNMEKRLINEALSKSGGVKSKAAMLLGLKRTTLIEKIKKMGMEKKQD